MCCNTYLQNQLSQKYDIHHKLKEISRVPLTSNYVRANAAHDFKKICFMRYGLLTQQVQIEAR